MHQHHQCEDLTEEEEMSIMKSCEEAIELQKDSRNNSPQTSHTTLNSNIIKHLKHYDYHHHSHSPSSASNSNNSSANLSPILKIFHLRHSTKQPRQKLLNQK